jgi:hypothetical protein
MFAQMPCGCFGAESEQEEQEARILSLPARNFVALSPQLMSIRFKRACNQKQYKKESYFHKYLFSLSMNKKVIGTGMLPEPSVFNLFRAVNSTFVECISGSHRIFM